MDKMQIRFKGAQSEEKIAFSTINKTRQKNSFVIYVVDETGFHFGQE